MWHRYFTRFCGWFYFSRLRVVGAGRRPATGPVLWLGLHRNGAVDGFVYAAALRRPLVFMISTQLRKNFLARIFFGGVAVARHAAEGERKANRAALAACADLLASGGELFVFPEGTSSLGPRHLPFKAGAAQLALNYLQRFGGPLLSVVPVGVHYDSPETFRSHGEIVIGDVVDVSTPDEWPELGRLREARRRIASGLESVGANFPDEDTQREAEAVATLANLALGSPRFAVLKACERGTPPAISAAWRALDRAATLRGAWRYHGVPLLPRFSAPFAKLCGALLLGPIVVAGIAVNAPPWLAARWAAQCFPDGRNVVSLWKILAGLPVFAVWLALVISALGVWRAWPALIGFVALSVVAWLGYDSAKRLGVEAVNGFRHQVLRPQFDAAITAAREAFLK